MQIIKYSFVIPCYGSFDTIDYVLDEIHSVMKNREVSYEIIAVVDFSPDNVFEILKKRSLTDKALKVINLAKNSGKHSAMMAGFKFASGEIIVNLDDDGQCPMDKFDELIEPLHNGYDISIAKYETKQESFIKRIGSKINDIMSRILISKPKNLLLSNFSAVKSFVVKEILKYQNPYPYIDGLFLRTTSRIKNVTMTERKRISGQGNFNLKKSLGLWLNGFTAFSVKPLRISSLVGVICALCGFVFGIVTIIRKLCVPNISAGWSSTVSILLFIGGLIMLMLGMIGEYIGRIYISINNSPQYVIKETINIDEDDENEKSQ